MKAVFLILALGYSALIVALSSISSFPVSPPSFQMSDKLIHMIEYFIFAVLWCLAVAPSRSSREGRRRMWGLFIAMVLFALSDEIHQAFVPGREADILDWAADICGISVGLFVFLKLTTGRGE